MHAVWLVVDIDRPLMDIVEDIEPLLPDLYFAERIEPVGPPHWRHHTDEDGQCWVVLDVDTRPWSDPRRDRDRSTTR